MVVYIENAGASINCSKLRSLARLLDARSTCQIKEVLITHQSLIRKYNIIYNGHKDNEITGD